jgi:hypothetical protein
MAAEGNEIFNLSLIEKNSWAIPFKLVGNRPMVLRH